VIAGASFPETLSMKRLALILSFLAPATLRADTVNLELTVRGGPHDLKQAVCVVPLSMPAKFAEITHVTLRGEGVAAAGQLTEPGLTTEHIKPSAKVHVRRDLHFILPELKRDATLTLKCAIHTGPSPEPDPSFFDWVDKKGEVADLEYVVLSGARRVPVMSYMYKALDESSKDARDLTYKVFHHLFDPAGKRLVTNGGPTGLYPHHRGLMYAFNKISYDNGKKKADTWHCTNDAYQSHEGFLRIEGGPIVGRHRVAVGWHGPKTEMFAKEERELTVYKVPGGTLVEFASRLKTLAGPIRLDGDPQHAGFQFRADKEVADKQVASQTYYLRPDGKGDFGETRNWDPKTRKGPVDLPWDAMSFVLGGKRYTVVYMDGPNNPHPERYSERDYGRFGCYFEYDLTAERPLVVNYRVWLQDGEMTVEQAELIRRAFVEPPQVMVKGGR
jgi:hypothetical protein